MGMLHLRRALCHHNMVWPAALQQCMAFCDGRWHAKAVSAPGIEACSELHTFVSHDQMRLLAFCITALILAQRQTDFCEEAASFPFWMKLLLLWSPALIITHVKTASFP